MNDSCTVAFLAGERRDFGVPQRTPSWQVSIFPTPKPWGRIIFLKIFKELANKCTCVDLQAPIILKSVTCICPFCLFLLHLPQHLRASPVLPRLLLGLLTGPLRLLYPDQAAVHVGANVICLITHPVTPNLLPESPHLKSFREMNVADIKKEK